MQQSDVVEKLQRPLISKLIQDYIRDYIVKNALHSGDALPVQGQIAKDLGVSLGSVREAVRSLESLGLLEVRHGDGLYVRGMNFDALLQILLYSVMLEPYTLLDLLQVREMLEISTIPKVVQQIQEKDLEACRQILDDWRAEVAAGLPGIEKDQLFHQTLYRSVGNKLLSSLVHIFWLAYRNAEERTIPVKSSRQSVLKYHFEIFEAVEARDVELAQRLIVEHFQRVEERFRLALEGSEQRKAD
ncbi:FadR/GntR family transcriptional regulator [Candidatus Poribacteria bacterium]